jgi:hypothetical protein
MLGSVIRSWLVFGTGDQKSVIVRNLNRGSFQAREAEASGRSRVAHPADQAVNIAFEAQPSVLKRHADKIVMLPDNAAPANGVKIIECQLEARRQYVKASQLYSGAAIGDIPNRASEYAARRIEK